MVHRAGFYGHILKATKTHIQECNHRRNRIDRGSSAKTDPSFQKRKTYTSCIFVQQSLEKDGKGIAVPTAASLFFFILKLDREAVKQATCSLYIYYTSMKKRSIAWTLALNLFERKKQKKRKEKNSK